MHAQDCPFNDPVQWVTTGIMRVHVDGSFVIFRKRLLFLNQNQKMENKLIFLFLFISFFCGISTRFRAMSTQWAGF
jgi:hypothetical protein